MVFLIKIHCLIYLSKYSDPATDYAQDNKDCDEKSFCAQPFIQEIADGKTEKDTSRHGQSQLSDQDDIIK